MQAMDCDANASFNSIRSRSAVFIPALASAFLLAGTGPEALELQLFSLKPKAGLVLKYYPAIELAKRKTTKGVATFKLGTKKPSVSYPDTKHYPFEKLGYIPNNKGQYES